MYTTRAHKIGSRVAGNFEVLINNKDITGKQRKKGIGYGVVPSSDKQKKILCDRGMRLEEEALGIFS